MKDEKFFESQEFENLVNQNLVFDNNTLGVLLVKIDAGITVLQHNISEIRAGLENKNADTIFAAMKEGEKQLMNNSLANLAEKLKALKG